mgnify:CR=1 FL=1
MIVFENLDFLDPQDYSSLVRSAFSSNLPYKHVTSSNIVPKLSPRLWENGFQHCRQKYNFYCEFMGNRLRQHECNDRGIISRFHGNSDFDKRFASQSQCFPENLDLGFLCLNKLFLFGGQICEAFIFLEYRI